MASRPTKALLFGLALWAAGLGALVLALEREAPLFLDLGAGDAPFARGFRSGWERDGLAQSGDTMFHWTEDGSRLEFPVTVEGEALSARMRLARFASTEAEITLLQGGRVVERWVQPARGFSVRRFELGATHGPLMLRFRSEAKGGDPLGVALDWVEVSGARRVWPLPDVLGRVLLALFGAPLAAAAFTGVAAALGIAVFFAWCGAAAVSLDRLGGLVALADAALPALLAVALLGLLHRILRRFWPEHLSERAALVVPAAAVFVACLMLFHPFFYYPDVDTHARFLAAIRADAWTAVDPQEFQARTGAWTRTIAGNRVAFPYAPFFHLAAWPLAPALGEAGAVKTLAAFAVGLTLLAAFGLARALLLPPAWGFVVQGLVALLPVTASRLSLALFPALLGQSLETLLGLHLVRRFGHLDGARDAAAATLFLFAVQAVYTGSLFNVAALVYVFAAAEAALGERRRAARLIAAHAVAALLVALLLYARFVPTLARDVLPHAAGLAAALGPERSALLPLRRLAAFYDGVLPVLSVLGLLATAGAPSHARRYALAALLSGAALLGLRSALPTLLRDAKDVEMLAVPVALLASAALRRLWHSGEAGRLAAVGALLATLVFCVPASLASYLARFVAVGR